MVFSIVIPARYNSTRLPGKVLADIAGKPMLEHVYERAIASRASRVVIATDDQRIADTVKQFNAPVCLTSHHNSGTERLSEAVRRLNWDQDDIVVCVQGDEPQIAPHMITQLAHDLEMHPDVDVASICMPIKRDKALFDSSVVKVVFNRYHDALYFSRSPIPYYHPTSRQTLLTSSHYYRHVGLYAYRVSFLKTYQQAETSPLERIEQLEQLRILWHGGRIHLLITEDDAYVGSVDTPEDLRRVRNYVQAHGGLL